MPAVAGKGRGDSRTIYTINAHFFQRKRMPGKQAL